MNSKIGMKAHTGYSFVRAQVEALQERIKAVLADKEEAMSTLEAHWRQELKGLEGKTRDAVSDKDDALAEAEARFREMVRKQQDEADSLDAKRKQEAAAKQRDAEESHAAEVRACFPFLSSIACAVCTRFSNEIGS